jgi:hypothetical protein
MAFSDEVDRTQIFPFLTSVRGRGKGTDEASAINHQIYSLEEF